MNNSEIPLFKLSELKNVKKKEFKQYYLDKLKEANKKDQEKDLDKTLGEFLSSQDMQFPKSAKKKVSKKQKDDSDIAMTPYGLPLVRKPRKKKDADFVQETDMKKDKNDSGVFRDSQEMINDESKMKYQANNQQI